MKTKRDHDLKIAAAILDAEVRLIFGEGIDDEQRQVVECSSDSIEIANECLAMLDDMESRMGVNVARVRELIGLDDDDDS